MPVLLISGGTRGIGWGLTQAFARAGWAVSTCYHQDEASAESARAGLQVLTPDFLVQKADVTRAEDLQAWIDATRRRFSSIDCVIHNAGATHNARLLNLEEADWDKTLEVHLGAAFRIAKACLRPMLREGGQMIFISSVVATTGNVGQCSYAAAKAGLVGLARSLAREYGSKNIRVNVVCPGFHKTRLSDGLSEEAERSIRAKHLLPLTTDLKEVEDFALWLAGTKTISGQVFNLDSRIPGWL
ncbi:MAG TPA: SDR family oxidoreductase [bacterium]|nr:SDR family oxidoreductase [bacterium]